MDWMLDDIVELSIFLRMIVKLWLCRRLSLFSGDSTEIFQGKVWSWLQLSFKWLGQKKKEKKSTKRENRCGKTWTISELGRGQIVYYHCIIFHLCCMFDVLYDKNWNRVGRGDSRKGWSQQVCVYRTHKEAVHHVRKHQGLLYKIKISRLGRLVCDVTLGLRNTIISQCQQYFCKTRLPSPSWLVPTSVTRK